MQTITYKIYHEMTFYDKMPSKLGPLHEQKSDNKKNSMKLNFVLSFTI